MNPAIPLDPKGAAGSLKTPLGLVPPVAKQGIARVLLLGAKKYAPWNWRRARVGRMTYAHAIQRHLDAWIDGEDLDPESGVSHIAHVAASACIVLDAEAFGTLEDDRPPGKPPAGAASLSVPAAEPPSNIISLSAGSAPSAIKAPLIRPHICNYDVGPFGACSQCGSLP